MDLIEVEKQPTVVSLPHPLRADAKEVSVAAFLPNETLGAYIDRVGLRIAKGPVYVWHNGYRVPEALWTRLIPRNGDQIVIRARMQGGGDGSKILRTVAMVALVVVAAWAGATYGASLGSAIGVSAEVGGALISAGVMIGGSLLINALLPPPKPTMGQLGTGQKYESSPTYSIQGGRNRMRKWEPMALIFGRHKVVPDLGAQYYTEYVGDTQYLNQLFHFGLQAGRVELFDFKIGSTPITDYQGVEIQISGEDGKLSMFPGNVDTLQGFVVNNVDGWIQRTTPIDTNHINVELAAQLFHVMDNGGMASRTVELRVQYRLVGTEEWADIGMLQDAVYATHYWALIQVDQILDDSPWYGMTTQHQIAYGSTNYADHYPGEPGGRNAHWEWRPHPHAQGRPWRGIAPDPLIGYSSRPGVRLTGARQEPTRQTVSIEVPKGQYEVRVLKVTGDIKGPRDSNETAVSQILCFQPDEADYTGQLRVALRIKATHQLNGAIDEFNAIAQASAPVWNGERFDIIPTSNPAACFLDFALGKRVDGVRVYGAGLDHEQIDFDSIKAWQAWCESKNLTFDYVLDRKVSQAEILQIIARAGRASPTWQSGKLGVVWDAADLPVVAMFGPFNIRAGTFKIDYINEGTADEIVGNFINPERDWQMDEVRVRVPGATTTNNPLQLDLEGCTNPEMAGREVNLLAASQVWHRRRVTWETDIEGWVANRGDVVQISHDLTVWGYSGRLLGRSGNQITLSQRIPTGSGTMLLRDPEGQMKTVTVTGSAAETDTVTIATDMSDFPLPGDAGFEDIVPMDWAWFFDPLATPGRRFKIVSVEPSGDGVKFQAIDDDPGYYASESNPYQYTPPRDGALLGGIVFAITVVESIVNVLADINNVRIGWSLSVDMPVDVVVSVNGVSQPAVRVTERNLTVQAQTGDVLSITVTPVTLRGTGQPATQDYVVQGLRSPLPAVTGLTNVFRDGLTVLVWNPVVDIRQPVYEVRLGDSWSNSRAVAVTPTLESLTIGNGLYWVAARYAHKGEVIYGPPDSLQVAGAALVRNVLITEVEDPDWDGELSEGAHIVNNLLTLKGAGDILAESDIFTVRDVLWYGGAEARGVYTTHQTVDIGYVAPVRLEFLIDAYALNFGEDVLSMDDVLANPDILNESNAQHWRVTPQYRTADEDMAFTGWVNYVPGLINARYFEVRLVIETDEPLIVPFIEHFTWIVDVPDLIQKAESVAVPAEGLNVVYEKTFHAIPNVQIATFDAIDGDRYVLTDSDETGFQIRLFNGSTPKSGVINWLAQGY